MTKEHTSEEIKYRLSNIGVAIGNIALDYIAELEKENAELKEKLECAEHNCKVKQEFNDNQFNAIMKLKDEFTNSLAYTKSIIKDLLNNSDEYAKQRAREFLEDTRL